MTIRPDFRFLGDRHPTPCDICGGPIESWNITTFVGPVPVVSICAACVIAAFKVVASTPAALQSIDPTERRHIAQAIKASVMKEAVAQVDNDNATARRLLS